MGGSPGSREVEPWRWGRRLGVGLGGRTEAPGWEPQGNSWAPMWLRPLCTIQSFLCPGWDHTKQKSQATKLCEIIKYCSSHRLLAGLLYKTENWKTSPVSVPCSSLFLCPDNSNLSLRSQLLCHIPWGAFPYLLDWVNAPPSCSQRTQYFHLPFILPQVLPLRIAFQHWLLSSS